MRPSILFPFFAEIRSLGGVGPKVEKLIQKVAGPRLVDLMFDLPTGLIDRSYRPKLAAAELGRIVTVTVNVLSHKPSRDRRQPYRVIVSDDTSLLELAFFHAHTDYLKRQLPEGSRRIISGKLERFRDTLQMTHPDHIVAPEDDSGLTLHEPVYALTEGLTLKVLAKAIRGALDKVVPLPEWDDPAYFRKQNWHAWHEALLEAHAPTSDADLSLETPARKRLAYDEL